MADLLPCPFCGQLLYGADKDDPDTIYPSGTFWRITKEGGYRHYFGREERREDDGVCYQIICNNIYGGCGAEMHADSKDEAIKRWNKRAGN